MGIDKDLGSIEVGKLADLVFFDPANNPLDDVGNAMTVKWVMKGGRMWRAQDMTQLLPDVQPLAKGPVLNTPSV